VGVGFGEGADPEKFCTFSLEMVHFGAFQECFRGSDDVTPSEKVQLTLIGRLGEGR